jgi:hypothetical protein
MGAMMLRKGSKVLRKIRTSFGHQPNPPPNLPHQPKQIKRLTPITLVRNLSHYRLSHSNIPVQKPARSTHRQGEPKALCEPKRGRGDRRPNQSENENGFAADSVGEGAPEG